MTAANNADLRRRARRRLPRMFFDYLDGGAFSETTLERNRADFDRLVFEQRVLAGVGTRSLAHSFLGADWSLPMMLGPVGFCGMMRGGGETLAARAAAAAGIPFCLSSFSIASIEAVAAATARPPAFQLYVFRDRALTERLVARALALGVETLVVTVDVAVSGIRERDTRNGFRTARRLGLRPLIDMALHPRWCLGIAAAGWPGLGNFADHEQAGRGLMAQASRMSAEIDPDLEWRDIAWLRRLWPGRLVVKGILGEADARAAVAAGADAVVVSNHGGRQLDGAPSSISVLPRIARAVGADVEVLLDGGIRRGADIAKALALGADAVLLGRAFVYGLAADGERGVATVIRHLRDELDVVLALLGVRGIAELKARGPELVRGSECVGSPSVADS